MPVMSYRRLAIDIGTLTMLTVVGPACTSTQSSAGSTEDIADGADGAAGAAGFRTLLRFTDEPAGANCTGGGTVVQSGRDEDRDGTLDDFEVDTTNYLCDGEGAPAGCDAGGAIGGEGVWTVIRNRRDFRFLEGCTTVRGGLLIDAKGLYSLSGLESITANDGSLAIMNLSAPDLTGLDNLQRVGGQLQFIGTGLAPLSLNGLGALQQASGIDINSTGLTSFVGIGPIAALTDGLTIGVNPALVSFSGLDRLQTLRWLDVYHNGALTSLHLPNLVTVGDFGVAIRNHDVLTEVTLPSLTTIGGDLAIFNNDALLGLNFQSLTSVGGELAIGNNDELPSCEANALAEALGMPCTCEDNNGAGVCQ